MRVLGIVGLLACDTVDGGPPRLGGAAFYAARALRVLRHPAVVATKFAEADRRLVEPLHAIGVPVAWRPAASTIAFRIENRGDERALVIDDLGEPWTLEEAKGWLGEAAAGADWLHLGALTRADFPVEVVAALAAGRILSLDGQGLARPGRRGAVVLDGDYDPEILRHVDVLKLSEGEARAIGLELDERAVASLGVREVIVTRGGRGSVVYEDGRAEEVRAYRVEAVDPTGAGDMFVAAYLAHRRRGHGPVSAARCATAVVSALLPQLGRRARLPAATT